VVDRSVMELIGIEGVTVDTVGLVTSGLLVGVGAEPWTGVKSGRPRIDTLVSKCQSKAD